MHSDWRNGFGFYHLKRVWSRLLFIALFFLFFLYSPHFSPSFDSRTTIRTIHMPVAGGQLHFIIGFGTERYLTDWSRRSGSACTLEQLMECLLFWERCLGTSACFSYALSHHKCAEDPGDMLTHSVYYFGPVHIVTKATAMRHGKGRGQEREMQDSSG